MPSSDTQFKGEGKGIPHRIQAIGVKFTPEMDGLLRDKSKIAQPREYIRQAVLAKMKADGLL